MKPGLIAVLIVTLSASNSSAESSTTELPKSFSLLALYDYCVAQEERGEDFDPRCIELGFSQEGDAEPGEGVEFCPESTGRECACLADNLTLRCTYTICGFRPGWYQDGRAQHLARRLTNEILLWGDHEIGELAFEGGADGIRWQKGQPPKPSPVTTNLQYCAEQTLGNQKWGQLSSMPDSYKDVLVAVLRGCGLREFLASGDNATALAIDKTDAVLFQKKNVIGNSPASRRARVSFLVTGVPMTRAESCNWPHINRLQRTDQPASLPAGL